MVERTSSVPYSCIFDRQLNERISCSIVVHWVQEVVTLLQRLEHNLGSNDEYTRGHLNVQNAIITLFHSRMQGKTYMTLRHGAGHACG